MFITEYDRADYFRKQTQLQLQNIYSMPPERQGMAMKPVYPLALKSCQYEGATALPGFNTDVMRQNFTETIDFATGCEASEESDDRAV